MPVAPRHATKDRKNRNDWLSRVAQRFGTIGLPSRRSSPDKDDANQVGLMVLMHIGQYKQFNVDDAETIVKGIADWYSTRESNASWSAVPLTSSIEAKEGCRQWDASVDSAEQQAVPGGDERPEGNILRLAPVLEKTGHRDAAVLAAYAFGMTQQRIAAAFGLTQGRVSQIIKAVKRGVQRCHAPKMRALLPTFILGGLSREKAEVLIRHFGSCATCSSSAAVAAVAARDAGLLPPRMTTCRVESSITSKALRALFSPHVRIPLAILVGIGLGVAFNLRESLWNGLVESSMPAVKAARRPVLDVWYEQDMLDRVVGKHRGDPDDGVVRAPLLTMPGFETDDIEGTAVFAATPKGCSRVVFHITNRSSRTSSLKAWTVPSDLLKDCAGARAERVPAESCSLNLPAYGKDYLDMGLNCIGGRFDGDGFLLVQLDSGDLFVRAIHPSKFSRREFQQHGITAGILGLEISLGLDGKRVVSATRSRDIGAILEVDSASSRSEEVWLMSFHLSGASRRWTTAAKVVIEKEEIVDITLQKEEKAYTMEQEITYMIMDDATLYGIIPPLILQGNRTGSDSWAGDFLIHGATHPEDEVRDRFEGDWDLVRFCRAVGESWRPCSQDGIRFWVCGDGPSRCSHL